MVAKEKIKIGNIQIAFQRIGKGDPMLLLHGITTSSFIWRNIQPDLAKKFDVIALDLLGCGESSIDLSADYSIKKQAEILLELIEKLELGKVHLVGHDIGGGISQIMCTKKPKKITDLTLINTVGYDYWPVQPITAMRTPIIRQIAMMSVDFGMLEVLIRKGIYRKDKYTEEFKNLVWQEMGDKKRRKSFLHFAKSLNNQHLIEISDKLKQINFPVQIVRGDGDFYLNSNISKRLHSDIPGSKLEIIKSGGHYLQEDDPGHITKLILEFCQHS